MGGLVCDAAERRFKRHSGGQTRKPMPYTSNGGIRLYWEAHGEGPPILLIMGHRLSSAIVITLGPPSS